MVRIPQPPHIGQHTGAPPLRFPHDHHGRPIHDTRLMREQQSKLSNNQDFFISYFYPSIVKWRCSWKVKNLYTSFI